MAALRLGGEDRNDGLQHPCQPTVQFGVHALKIRQCDFLLQYHFMERNDKVSVKESSVENAQAKNPSDELEIVEMLRVYAGSGIDLQRVVVMCRIFEKAIKRVEHLV